MKRTIDIDAILAPLAGDNPAGENLRYTQNYEDIKEARRADDPLDLGDWQHELKVSDWDKVISLSVEALTEKTKDLQIAAWLTEALTKTEGFQGLQAGLAITRGLLVNFWDHLYPEIEDDDLEFRAGPLEGLNDKLAQYVKEIPLTDPARPPGYSWFHWQESRQVGYEADLANQYGDIDTDKKKAREELIAEGKITAEEFDSAVESSPATFHLSLSQDVAASLEEFTEFDKTIDEKFGREAPRLAELKAAIEGCQQIVARILKDRKLDIPVAPAEGKDSGTAEEPENKSGPGGLEIAENKPAASGSPAVSLGMPLTAAQLSDPGSIEKTRWEEAVRLMSNAGMEQALELLYAASCSSPSIRDHNRYLLLMSKLCLKAQRPDLARPIAEKLYALIEELQLERWESPIWIADVIDTLYQCLTRGDDRTDEDIFRAKELLRKLCITDVTKAMGYKS